MTTLELNVRKANIAKEYPCQYTLQELRDTAREAIREYKQGKGVPHEKLDIESLCVCDPEKL